MVRRGRPAGVSECRTTPTLSGQSLREVRCSERDWSEGDPTSPRSRPRSLPYKSIRHTQVPKARCRLQTDPRLQLRALSSDLHSLFLFKAFKIVHVSDLCYLVYATCWTGLARVLQTSEFCSLLTTKPQFV